jgi:hypothetical protein
MPAPHAADYYLSPADAPLPAQVMAEREAFARDMEADVDKVRRHIHRVPAVWLLTPDAIP